MTICNEPLHSKCSIEQLLELMRRLRDPNGGCLWDLEQNFASIAPYTLEEAYEVADAIAREDWAELKGELGDLLLQVVFHAQMADEQGLFDFDGVAAAIHEKMLRRHPHVFGEAKINSAEEQTEAWEAMKAAEREGLKDSSQLANVPLALPALLRAQKLQKRAASVGFDWPDAEPVFAKIHEEIAELREAMQGSQENREEELGDLLFACANLARHLGIDSEAALRHANAKFERRFRHIEESAASRGDKLNTMPLDAMETLWNEAKKKEKSA